MLAFIARRLVESIPALFLATIAVFMLLHLMPGDAALTLAGPDASTNPQIVEAIRRDLGMDQPLPVQYGVWMSHVLRLDLGKSTISRRPVADILARRIPATLELTIGATVLTLVIALPLGITAALRQGKALDWAISVFNGAALAVPPFWFSILALMLFALVLGWLPPGGFVGLSENPVLNLKALILPSLALALAHGAGLARLVRSSMLEVLSEDYVRTARAKGLPASAVNFRHALRNALVPVVTVAALQFGRLLGGAVIIETIFTWPGLGWYLVSAIQQRDYAVVQGTLLVFVIAFIVVNMLTDLSYSFLDPRIRLGAARDR